jgi:Caspase domain
LASQNERNGSHLYTTGRKVRVRIVNSVCSATRRSLITYATAPGSVASDGSGRNGLYTENLLRYMMIPGLSVEQVFKQVRIGVGQMTNGQQTPWEASSLTGDFYFVPTGAQNVSQGVASLSTSASPPVPKLMGKQEQVVLKQPSALSSTSPEQRQGARVMVILLETSQGRRLNDPAGEKAMIRQLLQSGLSVVGQEQVQRLRDSDQIRKAVTGDREAVRNLGRQYGADVLIVGEASSEKAMSGGPLGQLVSVRAQVDARALRTDTGDILATDGQSASGVDLVESGAGKKAIEEAAKKWVETNLPRLRKR